MSTLEVQSPVVSTASSLGNGRNGFGDIQAETAFRNLYHEHGPGVFRMASRLCGPRLAADVTQEVFLQFWRSPERFDPTRGSLRSLLVTMAHHKSIDLVRTENARRRRELRSTTEDSTDIAMEGVLEGDRIARLTEELSKLPQEQREAIVITFYGHCSYREAAVVLGHPEGTVKSRIRAGLTQLRISLTA
jgi:RNA polymerase sigma-70 factor (ECF subfamily)